MIYEPSTTGRTRLNGTLMQRGTKAGFSFLGTMLFGGIFVAVGCTIFLVGMKVINVDPKGVHAPYWVLSVIGLVFAFAGLMVWGMGWCQRSAEQKRRASARRRPDEPAFEDYPWDENSFTPPRWKKAKGALVLVVFLAIFLSVFNWWAFFNHGPLMVKLIVGLFDFILLFAVWYAILQIGRSLKFGGSRLVFQIFPYRPNEPVIIQWRPANGISSVNKGIFTLRCVEEWHETRGHGKNRSRSLVQEEIWSAAWKLEDPQRIQAMELMEFKYQIPLDLPSTHLCADKPVFWEFDVKLDLPGLDFEESYLVPVYRRED